MEADTIVAIATPAGDGGIAVVRISGRDAILITNTILTAKKKPKDRTVLLARLDTGAVSDEVVVLYFFAPHSYTGEDVVEIQCHGSYFLAGRIVEALIGRGCRAAEPGEFTRRAFLNGRIDLTKAEGVLDLIGAQSDAAARAAYSMLSGGVYGEFYTLQHELAALIAGASAAIDYPEEDLIEPAKDALLIGIGQIEKKLNALKDSYTDGVMLRDGVRVTIAGEPNVGKSMLLNRLLGQDRAIVTAQAGTTRDTVEESFSYRGMRFVLTDTAGIRQASDEAERLGIERSRRALDAADLILAVSEVGQAFTAQLPKGAKVIYVKNKTDLAVDGGAEYQVGDVVDEESGNETVYISALRGDNTELLKERIYQKTAGKISGGGVKLNNLRHLSAVHLALESLERARAGATLSLDCMLSDLNEALRAIGTVTGLRASDEVVNEIFAGFCVGK